MSVSIRRSSIWKRSSHTWAEGWRHGLSKRPNEAKNFYAAIAILGATIGLVVSWFFEVQSWRGINMRSQQPRLHLSRFVMIAALSVLSFSSAIAANGVPHIPMNPVAGLLVDSEVSCTALPNMEGHPTPARSSH